MLPHMPTPSPTTSQTDKKTVFITGGTRGIGKAIVDKFKAENWNVATCGLSQKNLDHSAADLKMICDVGSAQEVKATLQSIVKKYGKIDVLINNAGLSGSNSLTPFSFSQTKEGSEENEDETWHRIIDTNLNGAYYVSKYGAPYLPDRSGRIINISSVLGLIGVPDASAYCAAKHGVIGLTRSFAQYLAPRKITVNSICPGWVRTDMGTERLAEIGLHENDLKTQVPLGRFIEPYEVADFVYFLASSPASSMITGKALTIDGGSLP
jgi:3-oxoacyl-[acyl-carrier protein] reductase